MGLMNSLGLLALMGKVKFGNHFQNIFHVSNRVVFKNEFKIARDDNERGRGCFFVPILIFKSSLSPFSSLIKKK